MWEDLSDRAREILAASHTIDALAVVESPLYGKFPVPVIDGGVDVDSSSQVRRVATMTTDPNLWPTTPRNVLAPFGSTCQLYRGVGLPEAGDQDAVELVPVGLFSLDKTKRSRSADSKSAVTLNLVDLSQRVAESKFPTPTQTLTGATYVGEITRLVREVLGDTWPVIDLTGDTNVIPTLDMARERWKDGIAVIAEALGAVVYFDQIGRLVIRPEPRMSDAPVWYARTGPGGNLLETNEEWNRDDVWNEWVINATRADGTVAFTTTVADNDPNSLTYVDGPFGRKTRYTTSPIIKDVGMATHVGQVYLERSKGLSCKVDLKLVVNPGLDVGDVIQVDDEDLGESVHLIDKCSIPLTATESQPLTTRSDVTLPPES